MTNPMRSLYRVYVVNPKGSGTILIDGKLVIAEDESKATLKAGIGQAGAGLELEQVDVYVEHIGTFIRPRTETQRVQITKEED